MQLAGLGRSGSSNNAGAPSDGRKVSVPQVAFTNARKRHRARPRSAAHATLRPRQAGCCRRCLLPLPESIPHDEPVCLAAVASDLHGRVVPASVVPLDVRERDGHPVVVARAGLAGAGDLRAVPQGRPLIPSAYSPRYRRRLRARGLTRIMIADTGLGPRCPLCRLAWRSVV